MLIILIKEDHFICAEKNLAYKNTMMLIYTRNNSYVELDYYAREMNRPIENHYKFYTCHYRKYQVLQISYYT